MRGLRLCLGLAGLIALAASGVSAQPVGDPLVVSGTLVDERGAPAAGVEVVLRPYPSQYEVNLDLLGIADALPEPADRAHSGPDGAFSLSAPLPGPYRFEIRPSAPADQPGAVLPKVYGDLVPLQVSRVWSPTSCPTATTWRSACWTRTINRWRAHGSSLFPRRQGLSAVRVWRRTNSRSGSTPGSIPRPRRRMPRASSGS